MPTKTDLMKRRLKTLRRMVMAYQAKAAGVGGYWRLPEAERDTWNAALIVIAERTRSFTTA